MSDKHKYLELDDEIVAKLHRHNLAKNGKVSDVVLNSIKHIIDINCPTMYSEDSEPVNLFKGMYIKKTTHWAGRVGYRTEIGLIVQSYWSPGAKYYYVDYIVVDEETDHYVGNFDQTMLHPHGQWTLSVAIENLGTAKEAVIKK